MRRASVLNAGSVWLVLTSKGKFTVVKPGDKEYEVVAEYTVSTPGGPGTPVFLGDRLLIKDKTRLASFAIARE
jgi:hypothetical protein